MRFIGQSSLMKKFKDMAKLPPFMILVAPEGHGKRTVSRQIAKLYGYPLVTLESNIQGTRECIKLAQGLSEPRIMTFYDADKMSIGAKNSLLKITEEPPKNVLILLTITDTSNMLPTIISRGQVFHLDPYTPSELTEYGVGVYGDTFDKRIVDVATNVKELQDLQMIGFSDFKDYVDKVNKNILDVSTSNSFKIADKINFKKDDENGYSVLLFLRTFISICLDKIKQCSELDDIKLFRDMIFYTQQALNSLGSKSINKKCVFDMWILNVRRLRKM